MKKLILVLIAMVTLSVAASAQKFGHITTDDIIQAMPETKAAQTALEAEGKKLEDQLQAMGVEYQNKVQAYQENVQLADAAPEKWSLALRADKEQEIIVATNGGYVYVMDKANVLFINETISVDLTNEVKKELGM